MRRTTQFRWQSNKHVNNAFSKLSSITTELDTFPQIATETDNRTKKSPLLDVVLLDQSAHTLGAEGVSAREQSRLSIRC